MPWEDERKFESPPDASYLLTFWRECSAPWILTQKKKGDLGPLCNKHSGMDQLRWIQSYLEINLHTERNRWQDSWKWLMQWTNYNFCALGQRKCVRVCIRVGWPCSGSDPTNAGFCPNLTKTCQKLWKTLGKKCACEWSARPGWQQHEQRSLSKREGKRGKNKENMTS